MHTNKNLAQLVHANLAVYWRHGPEPLGEGTKKFACFTVLGSSLIDGAILAGQTQPENKEGGHL